MNIDGPDIPVTGPISHQIATDLFLLQL